MTDWFRRHWEKVFVIKDSPQSIALGAAIGMFLGFSPLFGLKTLLALLLAFLFRVNKIAAVVAVSLHDVLLPFWPVVYRLEYDIGYWLLHKPHRLPPGLGRVHWHWRHWLNWASFHAVGGPMLVGAVVLGAPAGLLVFYLTKTTLARRQQRKLEMAQGSE